MNIPEAIEELLKVCWNKNMNFDYNTDETAKNTVTYDVEEPCVNIIYNGQDDDEFLSQIIDLTQQIAL